MFARLTACSSRSTRPTGSSSSRASAGAGPGEGGGAYALRAGERAHCARAVAARGGRRRRRAARVARRRRRRSRRRRGLGVPIEAADFVVFDLETTGLSPSTSRICEIGAQRVSRLELGDVVRRRSSNPRMPAPGGRVSRSRASARASFARLRPVELAVRRFLAFAGDGVLVAHNARFDMAFLDREVERLTGRRVAAPVVDTVWLARRLLEGRVRRVGLASLAHSLRHGRPNRVTVRCPTRRRRPRSSFGSLGLAQERGARTRRRRRRARGAEGAAAAREAHARRRRAAETRRLPVSRRPAAGAVRGPGAGPAGAASLLLRGRAPAPGGRGGARRARTRRVARDGLGARGCARGASPDPRAATACECAREGRQRGTGYSDGAPPGPSCRIRTPYGPIAGKTLARRAARALAGHDDDDPAAALPGLRERLGRLAREQRFEDAARLRDRIAALEAVLERLAELRRLRALRAVPPRAGRASQVSCAPSLVAGGRIAAARTLPLGAGAAVEVDAALAEAAHSTRRPGPAGRRRRSASSRRSSAARLPS